VGELLGHGTAMREPDNICAIQADSVEDSHRDRGELDNGHGPYRRRTVTDAGGVKTDHRSPVQLPGERVPALERAGHSVDQQERIALTLNLHGDPKPRQAGQARVYEDRTY